MKRLSVLLALTALGMPTRGAFARDRPTVAVIGTGILAGTLSPARAEIVILAFDAMGLC